MPTFTMRPHRVLPGPLRVLQPRPRRRDHVRALLAAAATALGLTLLLLPHATQRGAVDPAPAVASAEAPPRRPVRSVAEAASPGPAAQVLPAPSPAPERGAAAVPAASADAGKPVMEASLFQLDRLPVLEADGAGLGGDAGPEPAPARARPKAVPRRTAASSRTAAASEQP